MQIKLMNVYKFCDTVILLSKSGISWDTELACNIKYISFAAI